LKKTNDSAHGYLAALGKRVLVFDGAMGTNLQAIGLTPDDYGGEQFEGCIDYLVITKPEAVEEVHRAFLEVGADVIETDSFRANRITLGDFGLGDHSPAALPMNTAPPSSRASSPAASARLENSSRATTPTSPISASTSSLKSSANRRLA